MPNFYGIKVKTADGETAMYARLKGESVGAARKKLKEEGVKRVTVSKLTVEDAVDALVRKMNDGKIRVSAVEIFSEPSESSAESVEL